jgi:hypothetical protein
MPTGGARKAQNQCRKVKPVAQTNFEAPETFAEVRLKQTSASPRQSAFGPPRENTLWIYWEMPAGVKFLPPHIALCRKSMELNLRGAQLRLVTPENLLTYLPDFPRRLFDIRLRPRGKIEKYFGKRKRRQGAIPQRTDFIRAFCSKNTAASTSIPTPFCSEILITILSYSNRMISVLPAAAHSEKPMSQLVSTARDRMEQLYRSMFAP